MTALATLGHIRAHPSVAHLIFKRNNSGLNNLEGVVRDRLGDGILLKLAEVSPNFREQLPGNDEAHILVDDGLDEGLEAVHQVVFAELKDPLQNRSVLVGEVAVGAA